MTARNGGVLRTLGEMRTDRAARLRLQWRTPWILLVCASFIDSMPLADGFSSDSRLPQNQPLHLTSAMFKEKPSQLDAFEVQLQTRSGALLR